MKKIFLICLALALTARADNVVFDTFGPGNTYDPGMAYFVGNGANHYEPGAQFIAGASGNLSTIDLGLTYFTGSDPSFRLVNVFLYGIASALPDNATQTFLGSVTPTALFDGLTNNAIVTLTVGGIVPVAIGSVYWLVLKPSALGTADAWNLSQPAIVGQVGVTFNDSTWVGETKTLPAFRINAIAAVPDSGGTFLLMLGSSTMILVLRLLSPQPSKRGWLRTGW